MCWATAHPANISAVVIAKNSRTTPLQSQPQQSRRGCRRTGGFCLTPQTSAARNNLIGAVEPGQPGAEVRSNATIIHPRNRGLNPKWAMPAAALPGAQARGGESIEKARRNTGPFVWSVAAKERHTSDHEKKRET